MHSPGGMSWVARSMVGGVSSAVGGALGPAFASGWGCSCVGGVGVAVATRGGRVWGRGTVCGLAMATGLCWKAG